jgi:hypothetical protein
MSIDVNNDIVRRQFLQIAKTPGRIRTYLDSNAHTSECDSSIDLHVRLTNAKVRFLAQLGFRTPNDCKKKLGNPSSGLHDEGRRAKAVLESARAWMTLECRAPELVFTSGATESNHLALVAGMAAATAKNPRAVRIVHTPFEHPRFDFPKKNKPGVRLTENTQAFRASRSRTTH